MTMMQNQRELDAEAQVAQPVRLKLLIKAADPATGDITDWEFREEGGCQSTNSYGDMNFRRKSKWGAMRIEIAPENRTNYEMTIGRDPVWIGKGENCLKASAPLPPEFQVLASGQDEEIHFLNRNKTELDYCYTLCFESRDSQTGYFLLDPVISNGGGGNVR